MHKSRCKVPLKPIIDSSECSILANMFEFFFNFFFCMNIAVTSNYVSDDIPL